MDDQIMPSRHRRTAATPSANQRLVAVRDHEGSRRWARRIAQPRRVAGLLTIAIMMTLLGGISGTLALWPETNSLSTQTRVLLGAATAFTVWATAFLIMEAIRVQEQVRVASARRVREWPDARMDQPHPGGRGDGTGVRLTNVKPIAAHQRSDSDDVLNHQPGADLDNGD